MSELSEYAAERDKQKTVSAELIAVRLIELERIADALERLVIAADSIATALSVADFTTIAAPGADGNAIAQLAAASPRIYARLAAHVETFELAQQDRYGKDWESREVVPDWLKEDRAALAEARGELRGKAS